MSEKENLKTPEKPVVDEKVEPLKIKKRPRNLGKKDEPIKIDLNKKKEDAVQEPSAEKEVLQSTPQKQEEGKKSEVELQTVGQTHKEQESSEETKVDNVIEEITETTENFKPSEDTTQPAVQQKIQLPENVENLVNFMSETGGNIEDYVRLNADYSNVDDDALLKIL